MAHLAGGKYASSHTTVIDAVVPIAKAAAKLDCVSKIVLGVIKSIGGRPVENRLKIVDVEAGLLVTVRGTKSVQTLYIYTSDRERTSQIIQKSFE